MHNSLASRDIIGETNWCSHIWSLLFRTNNRDVWENQRVENANRLIQQVKLSLINTYKADWSNKARNSIKYRPLARIISVLYPRHKVDKGNEMNRALGHLFPHIYRLNWARRTSWG